MTIRIDEKTRTLKLGVSDLIRLLTDSSGFPQSGSVFAARWGQEFHRRMREGHSQNGRSAEVHVSHQIQVREYSVTISGRIDLLHKEANKTVVQEVKTVAVAARELEKASEDDFPAFRDQLRIYLYLLGCKETLENLTGRLTLVSILDGSVVEIPVTNDPEDVFLRIRGVLLGIIQRHESFLQKRDYRRSLAGRIRFPFASPRKYQEEAGAAVSDVLQARNNLLLSAPTGMGKTAAVLTAALRHALENDLYIFWASGKGSHQAVVAETLRLILPADAQVSAVLLMAKEKLCLNETFVCEEHLCRYSGEFSAKLKETQAVEDLLRQQIVTPEDIVRSAESHQMCPFELSLEAASRADFVVGDYNYIFDPKSSLRRLFSSRKRKGWILVIDEAHNLYSRARGYFSPALGFREVEEAEQTAIATEWCPPDVVSVLGEVRGQAADIRRQYRAGRGAKKLAVEIDRDFFSRIGSCIGSVLSDYFLAKLRAGAQESEDSLELCLLAISSFCAILELEGDSVCIYDSAERGSLKQVCLDPSHQLGETIRSFSSVIAVSATLEPHQFFRDVLGFPADETIAHTFASPFLRENRKVLVVPGISTTYRDRARTAQEVARLIRAVAALRIGNYAAFFPSFSYLRLVQSHLDDFRGRLLTQEERMPEKSLQKMLDCLKDRAQTNLILAVQGGLFAEGVDYADRPLTGAFIVGIGLPALSLENELLKNHFEEKYGAGFQYAYQYPGMVRVIQSAGRVIRSHEDAGFIMLIGRRYATTAYSSLLPRDWYAYSVDELVSADPVAEIGEFWDSF